MPDFNRIATYYTSPPIDGPSGPPMDYGTTYLSAVAIPQFDARLTYDPTPGQISLSFVDDTAPGTTFADLRLWVAAGAVPNMLPEIYVPLAWQLGPSVIQAVVPGRTAEDGSVYVGSGSSTSCGDGALVAEVQVSVRSMQRFGIDLAASPCQFIRTRRCHLLLGAYRRLTTWIFRDRLTDLVYPGSWRGRTIDPLPAAPASFSFWCSPASAVSDQGTLECQT